MRIMINDLTKQDFKSIYSNQEDVETFYTTALRCAKIYKRMSAYFSVGIFKHLKKGLKEFINNDGYMQLIISQEIDSDILRLINKSYLLKEEQKNILLSRTEIMEKINELIDQDEADIFSYLIAIGKLDIKIAYKTRGIVHDKFGLISDGVHNLAYIGSNNFTENAATFNDEAFQVTIDWDNPSKRELDVIDKLNDLFDKMWLNQKKDVITLDLPDPILTKMIENIDYNKIRKIKKNFEFVRLDLDENRNFIITSNIDLTKYFTYKNLREYSNPSFLSKTSKGYILKNITQTVELYDFKKLVFDLFEKEGISCYITKRTSDFFELNYRDYSELAEIGENIKSEKYCETEEFLDYQREINNAILRPLKSKQIQAAVHIIKTKRSLNFSVPGSGKTSTVLGAFEYLSMLPKTNKNYVNKLLVVGPKNCAKSWRDEYSIVSSHAAKHSPLCLINEDNVNEKKVVLEHDYKTSRLIVMNYELITKVRDELYNLIDENTMIVLDEIHRIKKIDSSKYLALKKIMSKTKYRVALTGTPLPNGYVDLYNMISLLHDDYTQAYFRMYESQLKADDSRYRKTGLQNIELNQSLYPFYIRVSKKDLNVPLAEPDHLIDVQTNNYERELYYKIKNAKYNSFESTIKLVEIGCVPFKCDQNYEDYDQLTTDELSNIYLTSKLCKFLEIIKNNNNKCVVWCNFVDTINLVTKLLQDNGFYTKCIYGSIEQDERDKIIDEFNFGNLQIIVTNPATLAESVSLHKSCHEAHYLELNYNLYQYLQSRDRIHRLGIKENDRTDYYIYINYYDDQNIESKDFEIYNALKRKEELMKKSIEKGNFVFGDTEDFE